MKKRPITVIILTGHDLVLLDGFRVTLRLAQNEPQVFLETLHSQIDIDLSANSHQFIDAIMFLFIKTIPS